MTCRRHGRASVALLLLVLACQGSSPEDRSMTPRAPTLRTITVNATAAGRPRYLLVALHGVGSSADDLVPLVTTLAAQLPDVDMVVPDGLAPFDGGGGSGRQWFSVRGVSEDNRVDRIREITPALSAWIDVELGRRHLTGDRLILLGFSQGAIVSNYLMLARDPAPHAVVSIAGRLAIPAALHAQGRPEVLVVHGTADVVIAPALGAQAAAGLRQRGAVVVHEEIPGLGHGIDHRAVAAISKFLTRVTVRPH